MKKNQKDQMLVLLFITMLLTVTMMIMIPTILSVNKNQITNYLTASDIDLLQETSKNISNQDQKIDFLLNLHLRQIANSTKKNQSIDKEFKQIIEFFDFKMILVLLPIIVIILCLLYLFKSCYPGSIFLWGDYIEHYKSILEKRKFIWNAIIFALIIGVLGNLFVFGISRYI